MQIERTTYDFLLRHLKIKRDRSTKQIREVYLVCPRCGKSIPFNGGVDNDGDFISPLMNLVEVVEGRYHIKHNCKPLFQERKLLIFQVEHFDKDNPINVYSPLDKCRLETSYYYIEEDDYYYDHPIFYMFIRNME